MRANLYHGNCLDIMEDMIAKGIVIDAIITDPPYGLNYRDNKWDTEIPNWLPIAQRLTQLIGFTTAPTTQWDYPRPDWVCCWHRRAAASRSANGGFNHWSPILIYGKRKIPVDFYETSFGKTVHENKHLIHPSPKPLELYIWLVDKLTDDGATVLDPFMGSGTTGDACAKLGRNFYGIEKDEEYLDEATRRIELAQQQMSMRMY